MEYKLFKPKQGERFECTGRGCLRFVRGDIIRIADFINGAMVPESNQALRLMPTYKLWKKVRK